MYARIIIVFLASLIFHRRNKRSSSEFLRSGYARLRFKAHACALNARVCFRFSQRRYIKSLFAPPRHARRVRCYFVK